MAAVRPIRIAVAVVLVTGVLLSATAVAAAQDAAPAAEMSIVSHYRAGQLQATQIGGAATTSSAADHQIYLVVDVDAKRSGNGKIVLENSKFTVKPRRGDAAEAIGLAQLAKGSAATTFAGCLDCDSKISTDAKKLRVRVVFSVSSDKPAPGLTLRYAGEPVGAVG